MTDDRKMDEVFEKARDLAAASGRPPQRMKVQSGDVVVEPVVEGPWYSM